MTEAEMWLEIAEAFGTPVEERNAKQRLVADCGLCFAAYAVGEGQMSALNGAERCMTYVPIGRAYAYGDSRNNLAVEDEGRCLAALWLREDALFEAQQENPS